MRQWSILQEIIRKYMNILITSAGQRVSLVRAFQRELRKIIPEGKVYTVDLNPILAPACHVSDGYKQVSRVTEPNYIEDLLNICSVRNVKMIIPTIDTELLVLAKNIDKFNDKGIYPIISSSEFISICRDKRKINDFFIERNISIPKPIDKHNPTFPLFIKPFDGSRSIDTFKITSKDDLLPYHYENKKLMFMEYVNPEDHDEYTVDAYYNKDGNLCCTVPRKRIYVRSGEINKGVTKKNAIIKEFKEKLSLIEGAVGCLTIQVFLNRNTNRIIGIEINPRFGGGFPLSYLAGANFPKWLIKEYFLGEDIEFFDRWEDNLLMLRYDDEILVRNYEE